MTKTLPESSMAPICEASASQGMLDQFWLWTWRGGLKNAFASIKTFSETDFKVRRKSTIR
jgi:hypothetical protein